MPPAEESKRIYLAGPMSGIPEFNFPRFNAVAAALRLSGHEVFNPAERDIERHNGTDISKGNASGDVKEAKEKHGFSLRQALYEDLEYITLTANEIVMLPDWERSAGAMAEHRTAVALKPEGMGITYLTEEMCMMLEGVGSHASAA